MTHTPQKYYNLSPLDVQQELKAQYSLDVSLADAQWLLTDEPTELSIMLTIEDGSNLLSDFEDLIDNREFEDDSDIDADKKYLIEVVHSNGFNDEEGDEFDDEQKGELVKLVRQYLAADTPIERATCHKIAHRLLGELTP